MEILFHYNSPPQHNYNNNNNINANTKIIHKRNTYTLSHTQDQRFIELGFFVHLGDDTVILRHLDWKWNKVVF